MNATATNRKTGKKALSESVDRFFWSLDWVTGGTREETLRQADSAIFDLEAKAAEVAALAANPAKLCAADEWLMNRALNDVPARVESYRARWVGKLAEFLAEKEAARNLPANVIPFPLKIPTSRNIMKKSELKIGMNVCLDGDVVKVTGFDSGGVIVEGPANGEELTSPAKLRPLESICRQRPEWEDPVFYD